MTAAMRMLEGRASERGWRGFPWVLFALVSLAFSVRFHGISTPAIWYDESFSVLLSERSPTLIWRTTAGDVHPPLYYLMLHYWMALLGNGVVAVRMLSVVVDIGTLLLCIKLVDLIAGRRAACMAGLLFALLPIAVRYSQEARMYTLIGFWLMAATVALVCWGRQPQLKRYSVMYGLLMTAAFYTHYFAALCVLVHWLYWSGLGSGEPVLLPVRRWLAANVAIIVLYGPWLPNFFQQAWQPKGIDWIPPATWEMLPGFIAQSMLMISVSTDGVWWALLASGLIIACCGVMLRDRRTDRRAMLLLTCYGVVPAIVTFVLSWAVPLFVSRYLVFSAVAFPMIVAITLDKLAEHRSLIALFGLGVVVAGQVQGLQWVYAQQDATEGTLMRRMSRVDIVAQELKHQVNAQDEVIFDDFILYLPFSYYNDTGIQPRLYVTQRPSADFGIWLMIPRQRTFSTLPSTMTFTTNRVWWVNNDPQAESAMAFFKGWTLVQTLKGGAVVARLFERSERR